jgi:hypothetical protein
MKHLAHFAVCLALVLTGCATSPKKFYEDPTKPDDTSLCRAALDPAAEYQFRVDASTELVRRGLTAEACQAKIDTQNAVIVGAALVGTVAAVAVACSSASCAGGGGNYYVDDVDCYGGRGNGPRWQNGTVWVGGYDPYYLDADGDGWGCEASDIAVGT